jgi:hypothetical protein
VRKQNKMAEVKINVSDKLNQILQKRADNLGVKKAELVKNFVVKELMELEKGDKR